ncbi:MAG: hypothetical protein ACPGU3_04770 [Litorivicinus sp.]
MKSWIGCAALAFSSWTCAQTLQIPLGQQGDPDLRTPDRGSSMSSVARHYGQPSKIQAGVGDPPIATWHYPQFRVYFEYDKVIHSVKNPVPDASTPDTGQ